MSLPPIGLHHYLAVSALLFVIGLFGLFVRRNILMVLLSMELLLNAAILSCDSLSAYRGDLSGQAVVFFTMIVAAAEVTVALAIIVLLYRRRKTTNTDDLSDLKW